MKKILFIFLLIAQYLGAYDSADYDKLISGGKYFVGADLSNVNVKDFNLDSVNFSNANLSGSYFEKCSLNNADFNNSNLNNSKLIDCDFTAKNISKISNAENLILLRVTIDDTNTNILIGKGAFIPNKSIICNSDLHTLEDGPQEEAKIKQFPRMIEAAYNSKNNVVAIVYAGDLCQWGDTSNWGRFLGSFYAPFTMIGKPVLATAGNHDRWQREDTLAEKLNVWSRTLAGLGSVAVEGIKDLYGGSIYYKKYVSSGMDIISLGECPTMTNRYNKGAISWYKNLSHKYPEIIFYHYSPFYMKDWWTTGDSPRPTDLSRGEAALESFNDSLTPYKDRISLMITGHAHSTFFRYWKGIPVVNVGGRDRFALCHFYTNRDLKINKCVAIEFIHYDSSEKSVFHYPCLGDEETTDERALILTHIYRTCLDRDPDPDGLQFYLDNWYLSGEQEGIEDRIKNSEEGILLTIRKLYIEYLEREPDTAELNNYFENWDSFGREKGSGLRIQNSMEGRPICLRRIYLEFLNREPDDSGFNYYLTYWDVFGGKLGVEVRFIKSSEFKTRIITDLYLTYLEREPNSEELKFLLEKSDIEDEFKKLDEVRVIIIKNLYLECLNREVNEVELKNYLYIWNQFSVFPYNNIDVVLMIEQKLKNSIEGRSIALINMYLTYLKIEPHISALTYYVDNWVRLGSYSGVEKIILNLVEVKKIMIKDLFQEYLDRDATRDEQDYYLEIWDNIAGEQGIEEELKTYYSN